LFIARSHVDHQTRLAFRHSHVARQDVIDQQKQLIVKLRSAAVSRSLPSNVSITYSQPAHRSGRSTGNVLCMVVATLLSIAI